MYMMDYVRICKDSRLRRVIVDRRNLIHLNTVVGYDSDADIQRYHDTDGDMVVVPKGKP
jgi:glucose-1-phosphate adenylyltransferase